MDISAVEFNKKLKGLEIKKVNFRPQANGRGGQVTDPIIHFTDGSVMVFIAEETDGSGEYGVKLLYMTLTESFSLKERRTKLFQGLSQGNGEEDEDGN